jgi:hypothetical protein
MTQLNYPLLVKTLIVLLLLEVIYLIVINLALSLPVTQKLINQIKPEKFQVSWESAKSWYPFRVHASGVSVNGQTRKQQWQVNSPEASASINLFPLLWKSVNLSNIDATDVDFRLRPRPREDKDYSKIQPHFAPIENRELETKPPQLQPLKKKRPWDISIDGISAAGNHRVWVYQMQMALAGELEASLDVQTRGGPFSLDDGLVDVNIESLLLNGNREVLRNGSLKGTVAFDPFKPKENKGIKSLAYLTADVEVDAETKSLAFLNLYLEGFQGMKVAGKGQLDGHLNYELGRLNADSSLSINASELAVDLLNHRAQGEGDIQLAVSKDHPDQMRFEIRFGELDGLHGESTEVLFTGDGLSFTGESGNQLISAKGTELQATRLKVSIPSVKVPDLALYQRYMPPLWSFLLYGGEGELQGQAELTQSGLGGNLKLTSTGADVGLKEYQFTTDLDVQLNVDASALLESGIDVSGTYIRLNNARVGSEEAGSSSPWGASIEVEQGRLKLIFPEEGINKDTRLRDLLPIVKGRGLQAMLDSENEKIKIRGKISDLRWLNVLLKNRFNMAFRGAGEIAADVVMDSGWLAPGTEINISPRDLTVDILDYVVKGGGGGHLKLAVEKGGESPDVSLDLKMVNASLKSRDEEQAFVENTNILFYANSRNMTYDGPGDDVDLHLQIPSAQVTDMSVYNNYLPPNSPLKIIDGQAELRADVMLKPEDADGYVKLVSTGMHALVDDQEVEAELVADIKLVDGVPRNMDFDITGSLLQIRNVVVSGDEKNFDDDMWGITLSLDKARAKWKKPVGLDLKASIDMTDSRPFVAMMANQKGKHGWLGKALTVDDVRGEATVNMKDNNLVIPLAYVSSEKIGVGAKGLINADVREGIVYIRFKKLDGLLKMRNGKRNLDLLKARKTFDQYSPGKSDLDTASKNEKNKDAANQTK